MGAVKLLPLLALCACSDLQGFGGASPPLATVNLEITGDPSVIAGDADLHVAMIWGRQWLVEPMCILPAENADAQAIIDAGCRDPFGFVPARVAATVPVTAGGTAQIDLGSLPDADVMVGDITARVAYASLVAYDDRDHSGTLELARPNRLGGGPPNPNQPDPMIQTQDQIVGASFISMTEADQRIAYREGAFSAVAAFYPRKGCGDPPSAFSVLAAGGFTAEAAIAATLAGTLHDEDPATCSESSLETPIAVPLAAITQELKCTECANDSSVRYREPEGDAPDFTNRTMACVHSPSFGTPSTTTELVVTGRSDDSCVGLSHYVLRGCTNDPNCTTPDWDHTAAPPDWWPCGQ